MVNEKEFIYNALDQILHKLEKLRNEDESEDESKNDKIKIDFLLRIQTLQTKLIYNALKDIDDMNDIIIKIIKMLRSQTRKDVTSEDVENSGESEEVISDEEELKGINSTVENKIYDLNGLYT